MSFFRYCVSSFCSMVKQILDAPIRAQIWFPLSDNLEYIVLSSTMHTICNISKDSLDELGGQRSPAKSETKGQKKKRP